MRSTYGSLKTLTCLGNVRFLTSGEKTVANVNRYGEKTLKSKNRVVMFFYEVGRRTLTPLDKEKGFATELA